MSGWEKYRLINLCKKIGSGATPRGGDASYKSDGISLIRSQNILDFTFSNGGLAFIDEQQAKELANVELKENDVLINITGDSVARVCQVPKEMLPARVNQHVAILRADQKKLSSAFLKYSLLARPNKELLLTYASIGATRKALTKGMLEEFEISIPDLPTQTRIASILSSLDDKIELNRRMNQTLEQMAQALFNHYFVDNIDPDNLPEGWRWGRMKELIYQSKASINPTKLDTIFHHYSIPAFDEGQKPSLDEGSSILSNKFFVKSYSVLFSKLNPRFPRLWLIGEIDESVSICSTEFLVFVPVEKCNWCFTYLQLSQRDVIDNLVNKAGGTSGSHQRVKPDDVLELKVVIPSIDRLQAFEGQIKPMLLRKIENLREIVTLTKIRDTLLPKLMSGEIDIPILDDATIAESV